MRVAEAVTFKGELAAAIIITITIVSILVFVIDVSMVVVAGLQRRLAALFIAKGIVDVVASTILTIV